MNYILHHSTVMTKADVDADGIAMRLVHIRGRGRVCLRDAPRRNDGAPSIAIIHHETDEIGCDGISQNRTLIEISADSTRWIFLS